MNEYLVWLLFFPSINTSFQRILNGEEKAEKQGHDRRAGRGPSRCPILYSVRTLLGPQGSLTCQICRMMYSRHLKRNQSWPEECAFFGIIDLQIMLFVSVCSRVRVGAKQMQGQVIKHHGVSKKDTKTHINWSTHHKTAGIEVVKNKNIRRKACVEEKKERRAYNRDPSNCRCELWLCYVCSGCSRRSKCECSCSRYDFLCEVVMTVLMNAVLMSCPLLPSIRILSQSCSLQYITKSHPAILSKCWSVLESNHAGGMGSTLGLLAPKATTSAVNRHWMLDYYVNSNAQIDTKKYVCTMLHNYLYWFQTCFPIHSFSRAHTCLILTTSDIENQFSGLYALVQAG